MQFIRAVWHFKFFSFLLWNPDTAHSENVIVFHPFLGFYENSSIACTYEMIQYVIYMMHLQANIKVRLIFHIVPETEKIIKSRN